jgi:hypothetical protein
MENSRKENFTPIHMYKQEMFFLIKTKRGSSFGPFTRRSPAGCYIYIPEQSNSNRD